MEYPAGAFLRVFTFHMEVFNCERYVDIVSSFLFITELISKTPADNFNLPKALVLGLSRCAKNRIENIMIRKTMGFSKGLFRFNDETPSIAL
ncbi:MAG: hypothetical protein SV375_11770 [Thermodesulfobacteriota bacterium]|nr:hypothetical protein [Thermodesulfobacteriota bacterium]